MSASDRPPSESVPPASRRDFLQQAAGLAAGAAALAPAAAADSKPAPIPAA